MTDEEKAKSKDNQTPAGGRDAKPDNARAITADNDDDRDKGDDGDDSNLDDNQLLVMRSIMDAQLDTSDKRRIGRVGDLEAEWRSDGSLVLTNIITGPQALGARVVSHWRPFFRFVFRDKFERYLSLDEVENFGPTLHLKGQSTDYPTGQAERWLVEHVLRWIPGSGYKKYKETQNRK